MTFCCYSLGCKANQAENDSIAELLVSRGHTRAVWSEAVTPGREAPGAVIINTCAVTGEASRKTRGAIRRARRMFPDAVLAVYGCFAEGGEGTHPMELADVTGGTAGRAAFALRVEAKWIEKSAGKPAGKPAAMPRARGDEFEALPPGAGGRARAFLKIQDGCAGGCAYCAIPSMRGGPRSMPFGGVVEAAQRLSENSAEIVLTGIEISAYDGGTGERGLLARLTAALAARCPDTRFRLGSLEPGAVDGRFVETLAAIGGQSVCPHFHLSLQSGCDATLRAMNRRYGAREAADAAALLRSAFPGCALGCDLIAGFPGESEADFAESLAFVEAAGFAFMHIFPFSARPGTPAASMPGRHTAALKRERAARASLLAGRLWRAAADACAGRTLNVLAETADGNGRLSGHAENYFRVNVTGAGDARGKIIRVKVTGTGDAALNAVRTAEV